MARLRRPDPEPEPVATGELLLIRTADFVDSHERMPEHLTQWLAATRDPAVRDELRAGWYMTRAGRRCAQWRRAQRPESLRRQQPGLAAWYFRPDLSPDGPPAPETCYLVDEERGRS